MSFFADSGNMLASAITEGAASANGITADMKRANRVSKEENRRFNPAKSFLPDGFE
ncbi:MAG: hypothetical protein OXE92_00485 [Bacteroidetes bacterium]|nr:hypothetical protein [Bacteroidota bacterium]